MLSHAYGLEASSLGGDRLRLFDQRGRFSGQRFHLAAPILGQLLVGDIDQIDFNV